MSDNAVSSCQANRIFKRAMEETEAERRARAERYRNMARMVTDAPLIELLVIAAEELERDADKTADENGGFGGL